jgi:hypothetical protein
MRIFLSLVSCAALILSFPLHYAAAQSGSSGTPDKSAAITVGDNLQVSTPNPSWGHHEVQLSVDPTNPKRMIACGIALIEETAQRTDVMYTTADGGKTWKMTGLMEGQSSDPTCQFGPDGIAYWSVESIFPNAVKIFTSADGGMTWTKKRETSLAVPGYDRQFFAIDDTLGKYHGRVYIHEWTYIRSLDRDGWDTMFEGMGLYHSDDHGNTWSDVMRRISGGYEERADLPGNCDFFSDGALACIFLQRGHDIVELDATGGVQPPSGLQSVRVLTAPPGGELFNTAVSITPPIQTLECPRLAIGRYTPQFKDRVYATWSGTQGGSTDIWSVYSVDHGKNWSKPIRVNDDHVDPAAPTGEHSLPQLVVNRQGVVGVMWYDHREDPKGHAFRPRFSASLDGAETFLPSVAIATAPHTTGKGEHWPAIMFVSNMTVLDIKHPKPLDPLNVGVSLFAHTGDTAGFDADPFGTFWALWIDNRTKYDQMWAASIRVTGTPVKHGSRDLADLDDVSDQAWVSFTNISFGDAHDSISVTGQLMNRSDHDLRSFQSPPPRDQLRCRPSRSRERFQRRTRYWRGLGV